MNPGFARFALALGLLSAVGPIAIDMYMPGLPLIAADLNTDVGAAQLVVHLGGRARAGLADGGGIAGDVRQAEESAGLAHRGAAGR